MAASSGVSPLRVALLSPCFWPEVRRGTERFLRELADGLIALGQRPALITSHRGMPSRQIEDGLPVLRLPRPPQGRLLRRRVIPYLTHVPLSAAALRLHPPDVAHAVYPTDALAAAWWRRQSGRPAVFSYMGIPDRPGLVEHRRMISVMRAATAGSDATVALSRYAARAFAEWLGVQPRVIPPGVDLESFRPAAIRAAAPTILCSAAADVPRKHVGLLVEAFAQLRRTEPEARLVLSRPRAPAAAVAAGVPLAAPGLEWRDLDDRGALAQTLGEAWLTVLPAENEAFGLVLAESLACGTPVLGLDDGAIPELIDRPLIGRTFSELTPDALAAALQEALQLVGRPGCVEACRARAEDFDARRTAERYLSLYRELGFPSNSSRGLTASGR